MSLIYKFFYIGIASSIFPISMGLLNWQYLEKPSKILLASLILGLVQATITIFILDEDQSSEWVVDLYMIIDILFMFWFYYSAVVHKRFRQILTVGTILMIILFFISTKFDTTINFFPSFQSFIFNATALFFFNYLLNKNTNESLTHKPLFWINTGFLLNSIVLVSRIYSGALAEESFKYYEQLYIFFYLVGILSNCLFGIGFIKSKQYKIA